MYTCLVVDDTMLQRDLIVMHLKKIKDLEVVAGYADGLEAFQHLAASPVDIVFSDIHMPELGGLALLKSLKPSPVFVFISDYPEYAAESFDLDVADYVVKPVSFERLLRAATKAMQHASQRKPATSSVVAEEAGHFFIRESSDLVKLRHDDVLYIESMGNFSRIHLTSGKHHLALIILKNLETQLPASVFTRIHKQYLINHNYINRITAGEVILEKEVTLPLSQSFRQSMLDKLVQHRLMSRNLPG